MKARSPIMPTVPASTPSYRLAGVAPARSCAYAVLRRVFERGAYADRAFLAEAAPPRWTRATARSRCASPTAPSSAPARSTTSSKRSPSAPPPGSTPRCSRRCGSGCYELLYTSGAPHYAIVADAVELAKGHARAGHGLVNAVLRRASREGPDTLLATLGEDTPEEAAVKHSHPVWIARMWWQTLGPDDARALMAADNEPLEVALRANTLVTDARQLARALPVPTHLYETIPEAVVLDGPFDAHGSPLWAQGAFHAQSRAAMLVARALAPLPGERVLDLCAAPGGKTTHIAALMGGHGDVIAVERNPRRAAGLERTARRLHAGNVRVRSPTRSAASDAAAFDRVLVDPPCSGLGTLQSRADLRWRVTPEAVAEMARDAGKDPCRRRARPSSGGRACLLYVHDLSRRERAPDRRLPRLPR